MGEKNTYFVIWKYETRDNWKFSSELFSVKIIQEASDEALITQSSIIFREKWASGHVRWSKVLFVFYILRIIELEYPKPKGI